MKKLKINCFGEGYALQQLVFSDEELAYIERAVNNGFLLEDILQHPQVDLMERNTELKHRGLLNTYKNQIEIWFAGKKIQKFKLDDLNPQFIAFPLYSCKENRFDLKSLTKGIYVAEKEIGLINSFEIMTENFEIEHLVFRNTEIFATSPFYSCDGVFYQNQSLHSQKNDTVVIEQRHIMV